MREALTLLGFGPCHHMYEVINNPVQKPLWRNMVAGGPRDWQSLFDGYTACMDWPSAAYWRELIQVYPAAKVILTWRSAESWWESFSQTILKAIASNPDPDSVAKVLIAGQIFGGRMAERDHAMALYRAHVEAVLAEVPADRLLVHRLGDGWEPLCAHLGVAVPDLPYPHGNSATEFHSKLVTQGRS